MIALAIYGAIAVLLAVASAERDWRLWERTRKESYTLAIAFAVFWPLSLDLMFSQGPSWRRSNS